MPIAALDPITQGITIAIVSMVGTLIALGLIAVCIYALHRFLPEPPPPPAPAPASPPPPPAATPPAAS